MKSYQDLYKELTGEELDEYTTILSAMPRDKKYKSLIALAMAGQRTRADWSNGYYLVKDVLDKYTDDLSTSYPDIYQEYMDIIDSDDIDGRVFRDTEHSYDDLYEMAHTLIDLDTTLTGKQKELYKKLYSKTTVNQQLKEEY